jgi:thioredoxin-like negative regulator of GroEL
MLRDERWTLVEFWAPDCLFSRLLAPVRTQLRSHFGDRLRLLCCTLKGVETNAAAFGADALPALVLFHGPTRVRRWLGATDVTLLQHQIGQTLTDATT